jgi:hypothetical protein
MSEDEKFRAQSDGVSLVFVRKPILSARVGGRICFQFSLKAGHVRADFEHFEASSNSPLFYDKKRDSTMASM